MTDATRHSAPPVPTDDVWFNVADVLHDNQSPQHRDWFSHSREHPCTTCWRWAGDVFERLAAGGYEVVRPDHAQAGGS